MHSSRRRLRRRDRQSKDLVDLVVVVVVVAALVVKVPVVVVEVAANSLLTLSGPQTTIASVKTRLFHPPKWHGRRARKPGIESPRDDRYPLHAPRRRFHLHRSSTNTIVSAQSSRHSKLIADTLWNEASQPFLAKYTSTFHKASASETCRRSPRSLHGDERRRHVHVQRLFEIHRGDRVAAAEKKTCTLELKDAGTISFKMASSSEGHAQCEWDSQATH